VNGEREATMIVDLKFERTDISSIWAYVMLKPGTYVFDMKHASVGGTFRNDWVEIQKTWATWGAETVTVIVAKAYAWNGASCAPDLDGVLEGTGCHDALYQFAAEIAKEWGWTVRRVLELADVMFDKVMGFYCVNGFVRTVYYRAVRMFGYVFWKAKG
jgi:GNAT superfamily N-acetyltransferase